MASTATTMLGPERILYEDAWLLAIDKPPGLPVHATLDPHRDHLLTALARLLLARDGAQGYLGLQHRLDLDTSGVLLLTRDAAINPQISQAFSQRQATKTYLAVTARPAVLPPLQWQVRNFLGRGARGGPRVQAVRSGGDRAETQLRLLDEAATALLIEAQPHTGRRHQIRVHLADAGMPLHGDRDYGGPPASRVFLHARHLTLTHPIHGTPLTISAPLPADFLAALKRLGLHLPDPV